MRTLNPVLIVLLAVAGLTAGGNESRLIDAVKAGNDAAVRALLKTPSGARDVNAREVDGTTALHWAARADDAATAKLLLEAGANASAANRYGVTPLALAATNGSAAMIEMLLGAGADAHTAMSRGETVLMRAARTGNPDAVKLLIAHGANVNASEDQLGETALMWAAAENHADAVKMLVEHGAELDARSKLLEYEKDRFGLEGVLTILPRGHWTALMYAARQGAVDAARVLGDAGADVNLTDPEGTTALVRAIVNGHYDVAGVLLEHGADPNIADATGMGALYAVAEMETLGEIYGRPARKFSDKLDALGLVNMLLSSGADPNARLKTPTLQKSHTPGEPTLGEGATPLMRAAKGGDHRIMQALLDHGADPSLAQKSGATALMIAAGLGRGVGVFSKDVGTDRDLFESVKLCLDHGVDVNAANEAGQTALHFAVRVSDSIVKLLADKGARLDAKDKQGRTPIDYAQGSGLRGRAGGPVDVREQTVALLRQLIAKSAQ
jgi:ankyrin repeat protein